MSEGDKGWMIRYGALLLVAMLATTLLVVWATGDRVTGDSAGERIESIGRLAAKGSSSCAEAIAGAAVEDSEASVREVAVLALGKFSAAEVRPAVEKCCSDAAPAVRSAAARTLIAYGDDAAAERVIEMARTDADPKVRTDALNALANTDADPAVIALVEAMDADPEVETRTRALLAAARKYGFHEKGLTQPGTAHRRRVIESIKRVPKVKASFQRRNRPLKLQPIPPPPVKH